MAERFALPEVKSSWEKYYVEIDCSAWLGAEKIVGASFAARDETGADVSATLIDAIKSTYTDTTVKIYVRGGTGGKRYTLTARVSTDGDNHREYIISMLVADQQ